MSTGSGGHKVFIPVVGMLPLLIEVSSNVISEVEILRSYLYRMVRLPSYLDRRLVVISVP